MDGRPPIPPIISTHAHMERIPSPGIEGTSDPAPLDPLRISPLEAKLHPHPTGIHHASKVSAETNVPDRHEEFLLAEGEKKVAEKADTRKSSSQA